MKIFGWLGPVSDPDFAVLTKDEVESGRKCGSNMYVSLPDYEQLKKDFDELQAIVMPKIDDSPRYRKLTEETIKSMYSWTATKCNEFFAKEYPGHVIIPFGFGWMIFRNGLLYAYSHFTDKEDQRIYFV